MQLPRGSAALVLGLQYGDEGKGKLVDVLAEQAEFVCRVQGGNNAGHTIWINKQKMVTQLLPSGILREHCEVGIGAGVVIDPFVLRDELLKIRESGYEVNPKRLHVDPRACLILPYHKLIDQKRETERSKTASAIGTTGRGIGPAYASRAYREGPRIAELMTEKALDRWFQNHPQLKEGLSSKEKDNLLETAEFLRPFVRDVAVIANKHLDNGNRVLIEGAQGSLLDLSFGAYPFVTSSNLIAGACAGGVGIPPWKITRVIGVIKAYSTKVGQGPYPAQIFGRFAEELRERGQEFGTNTGRPRDVGWLDLYALRYFAKLNGVTDLALMKSDVLSGLENIGVVTAYHDKLTQLERESYPITQEDWEQIEPVVEFIEGWQNTEAEGKISKELDRFVKKIEHVTGVETRYVSLGPERKQGIWR